MPIDAMERWQTSKMLETLERIEELLRELLKPKPAMSLRFVSLKPKHATSFRFVFQKTGEKRMLSLPLNTKNEKYFIIGTDASGEAGAQLAAGQTIAVASSDTTIVSFTPDAPAVPDAEGVPSVASGAVTPVAVGGPVTVTATVTNADGSAGETLTDTITVTAAVPGIATSIGVLFEGGVSGS